jgi:hypothetical protein
MKHWHPDIRPSEIIRYIKTLVEEGILEKSGKSEARNSSYFLEYKFKLERELDDFMYRGFNQGISVLGAEIKKINLKDLMSRGLTYDEFKKHHEL